MNEFMSKKVILDTDVFNEADDQFALTYLLKNQDIFSIEAITISPFKHSKYEKTIAESIKDSYDEACTIYDLLHIKDKSNIYKGATDYITNGYNENNEAVEKIIEVANKNSITYILAISGLTNIALAIQKCPEIISKIKVIWLGSNFLFGKNQDSNFKRDVKSVEIVFESKVDLTIIPGSPISSNLLVSVYEIEAKLKGKNEICDFLYQRFKYRAFGIEERWPLWDIAAIAYLKNETWFNTIKISCPYINKDNTFLFTKDRHPIMFVHYLNANCILDDLFACLLK